MLKEIVDIKGSHGANAFRALQYTMGGLKVKFWQNSAKKMRVTVCLSNETDKVTIGIAQEELDSLPSKEAVMHDVIGDSEIDVIKQCYKPGQPFAAQRAYEDIPKLIIKIESLQREISVMRTYPIKTANELGLSKQVDGLRNYIDAMKEKEDCLWDKIRAGYRESKVLADLLRECCNTSFKGSLERALWENEFSAKVEKALYIYKYKN